MSMITEREFEIWKFRHLETGRIQNVYFLPNNNLKSREDFKEQTLKDYKYEYELLGMFSVSKEYYLNSRLEDDLIEYTTLLNEEERVLKREESEENEVTLQMIRDMLRSKQFAIYRKVRRIMREGLQLHHDMAQDIYDMYHLNIEEVIDSLRDTQLDECMTEELKDYFKTIANSLEKVLNGDIETLLSMKEHIRRQKFTCTADVISFYSDLKVAYETLKDLREDI